jgi:hypothetical protein
LAFRSQSASIFQQQHILAKWTYLLYSATQTNPLLSSMTLIYPQREKLLKTVWFSTNRDNISSI